MQYTIRGISPALDAALRKRAQAAGTSLNEAAIEALAEGTGLTEAPRKRRDLSDIAGTWKGDKAFETAIATQDRVDEEDVDIAPAPAEILALAVASLTNVPASQRDLLVRKLRERKL